MNNLFKALLCIYVIQTTYANDLINKFDDKYLNYYSALQKDPQSVIDEMQLISKPRNNFEIAQYQYILSQAYYALVLSELAIKHAKLGLDTVTEESHPWVYYKLLLSLSMAYDISGAPSKGLVGAHKSLKWAQMNNVPDITIESLTTNGYLYLSLGEYIKSLDLLQQAYELAKQHDGIAHEEIAGIIALVYEYRKENELSIPFFKEVSGFHRSNKNWLELSIALYGLGRAHMIIGETDLGLSELQESLELSIKVDDYQGVGYALKELAGHALHQQNYQEAEAMILKSIEAFKTGKNRLMLFDAHKVMSQLKLKTNQLDLAQSHLNQALEYIDENEHPLQFISINKHAADVLAHMGEYEKAFKDLRKIGIKEKLLLSKQSTKQLHQLRSRYELNSKEKENKILAQDVALKNTQIQAQNQQNQLLILLFIFAIGFIALLLFVVLRVRKNKKHFEYLASYDGLTGVYTRSKTLELLKQAFEYSIENNQLMFVGMVDLDYFKSINDKFGHAAGDLVLKKVGRLLRSLIKTPDICGRFGGEEFLIGVISNSESEALNTFEIIRKGIEELQINFNNNNFNVTLSAGICSNVTHENIDSMIKCADDAMYQAKDSGRNQISGHFNSL